jgi:hypothetical protein
LIPPRAETFASADNLGDGGRPISLRPHVLCTLGPIVDIENTRLTYQQICAT